jgi:hypothetical protein
MKGRWSFGWEAGRVGAPRSWDADRGTVALSSATGESTGLLALVIDR